jgi:hypothetical protein
MGTDADNLRMFHTGAHPCGYWDDREARDLVLDPRDPRLPQAVSDGAGLGFPPLRRHRLPAAAAAAMPRLRGGAHPGGDGIRARPQPAALPGAQCRRRRAHRRAGAHRRTPRAVPRYLAARHAGGGMDDHGAVEFDQFLVGSMERGRFLELREHGTHTLLAVAVTDLSRRALSAVYTFYDPDHAARGLGTLGVLRQIEWARRDGRKHLYLGYWIAGHREDGLQAALPAAGRVRRPRLATLQA